MKTKIAAFRPENMLERAKETAERYGFDFFGFPILDLADRKEALKEIKDVFEEGMDIAVFTSANGVRKSFGICEGEFDLKNEILCANIKLCAIGPTTRAELERRGLEVDLVPEKYSTEGLKRMFDAISIRNRKIAFLRSSEGNKEIIGFLENKGAFVKDIAAYEVKKKGLTDCKASLEHLVEYKPDYIIFTSSMTFKTFLEFIKRLNMEDVFRVAKIVAIGDLTAETIREEGIEVDLVAEKSTFEDVMEELKDLQHPSQNK